MKKISIKKSIPALPAVSLKEAVEFYKSLGFKNTYENSKRSRSYAVMENGYLEFHIYPYKNLEVPTATNTYIYEVENVDLLYELFQSNYKKAKGKTPPRSGLPRVGTPKNLNFDRRFSITDPNGNHFIFAEIYESKRVRANKTRFEKLYWESNTLAYSHESPIEAKKMLEAAISRATLEREDPEIVFQVYVLLVDVHLLLEDERSAKEYYKNATEWLPKIKDKKDEDLQQSIEQYNKFNFDRGAFND